MITSEAIQRWVRIGLYYGWGLLGAWGASDMGQNIYAIVVSGLGFLATAAWTKYGSTVNSMLTEVGKVDGIKRAEVVVDPEKISPTDIDKGTPSNVVVKVTP
jgi:hypothetical protein